MKLYYSPPSPYARKVRVAVRELGLAHRVEEVETIVAPHKPNEAFGRDRKSTRLNSSHSQQSRMPSSA